MIDRPTEGTSWISAANGGAFHAARSPTGWTSYISYSTSVTGAPTSSSPTTRGWPPFDHRRVLQPMSASIDRTISAHSATPSPVALTDGWRRRVRADSNASENRDSRARYTSGGAGPSIDSGSERERISLTGWRNWSWSATRRKPFAPCPHGRRRAAVTQFGRVRD